MTNSTKPLRQCAMPGEPGNLRLGLLLYLLLLVVAMANEARADTCRLSLSQPRIDYGAIRRTERMDGPLDGNVLSLGSRTLHLSIICADPSAMALRFIGVPADGQGFRFGRQGRFILSLKHAQVDGQEVEWAVAHLPGELATGRLSPGQTLSARTAGIPVMGRRLTAQVDIDADLPSAALAVRGEALLEGLGNFELVSPAVPPNR